MEYADYVSSLETLYVEKIIECVKYKILHFKGYDDEAVKNLINECEKELNLKILIPKLLKNKMFINELRGEEMCTLMEYVGIDWRKNESETV